MMEPLAPFAREQHSRSLHMSNSKASSSPPTLFWRAFFFTISITGIGIATLVPKDPNKVFTTKTNMIAPPAISPFKHSLAGAAIVEAFGENIFLGSPVSEIVEEVYVHVGDLVEEGQPLYQFDTRQIRAKIEEDRANCRLGYEEVRKAKELYERAKPLRGTGAISIEEVDNRLHNLEIAEARLEVYQKALAADLVDLQRHTVCSPKRGQVLSNTIRKGEYINSFTSSIPASSPLLNQNPAMMIGDRVDERSCKLQLRVDIDEQNAARVDPTMPAIAYPKGLLRMPIPLKFLRIEPYVIPKQSLTGSSTERVDTRVLQVLYTFEPPPDLKVYIGQQFDAYIESAPLPSYDTFAAGVEAN